jgi:hypothetical protein
MGVSASRPEARGRAAYVLTVVMTDVRLEGSDALFLTVVMTDVRAEGI